MAKESVRQQLRKSSIYQPMVERITAITSVERPGITRSLCAVKAIQRMLKVELGSDYCKYKYSGLHLSTILQDTHGLRPVGYFTLPGYGLTLVLSDRPEQFAEKSDVLDAYRKQTLDLRH